MINCLLTLLTYSKIPFLYAIPMTFECKINEHNIISKVRKNHFDVIAIIISYQKYNNYMGNWSEYVSLLYTTICSKKNLFTDWKSPQFVIDLPWNCSFLPYTLFYEQKKYDLNLEISTVIVFVLIFFDYYSSHRCVEYYYINTD